MVPDKILLRIQTELMGNYRNTASEAHGIAQPNIWMLLSTSKETKMALTQDWACQASVGRVMLSNSNVIQNQNTFQYANI